ncbi:uncharacterized protein LOC131300862 [Rhododendron vialii]|uniref:uncharacterized protein LOC131300862 n=1 Tax=Rhododendron vialii TaxID=182163 RepID=UPI00265D8939|nr:uncharacterized protein LOC131300862 [Rhododendron vialii]
MMYRALIRSVETTYLFGYASTCTTNTTPLPQPLLPWVGFSFLSSVRMPSFYHHHYRSYHLLSLYTIFPPSSILSITTYLYQEYHATTRYRHHQHHPLPLSPPSSPSLHHHWLPLLQQTHTTMTTIATLLSTTLPRAFSTSPPPTTTNTWRPLVKHLKGISTDDIKPIYLSFIFQSITLLFPSLQCQVIKVPQVPSICG